MIDRVIFVQCLSLSLLVYLLKSELDARPRATSRVRPCRGNRKFSLFSFPFGSNEFRRDSISRSIFVFNAAQKIANYRSRTAQTSINSSGEVAVPVEAAERCFTREEEKEERQMVTDRRSSTGMCRLYNRKRESSTGSSEHTVPVKSIR